MFYEALGRILGRAIELTSYVPGLSFLGEAADDLSHYERSLVENVRDQYPNVIEMAKNRKGIYVMKRGNIFNRLAAELFS